MEFILFNIFINTFGKKSWNMLIMFAIDLKLGDAVNIEENLDIIQNGHNDLNKNGMKFSRAQ